MLTIVIQIFSIVIIPLLHLKDNVLYTTVLQLLYEKKL